MLSAPLLYLLKANAVLLLFAAGYFGLLRRLTFFELNRAYLAFALLFAAVYPALPMPALWPAAAPGPAVAWVLAELPAGAPAAAPRPAAVDWPALLLAGYAAGAAVLLGRLLGQLWSLARLHRSARPAVAPGGVLYRQLRAPAGPFSFGRTIYLHPGRHPAAELAAVLAHEQAHVRQGHTFDVLLAHVGTALFWANPAAWLLRRALLDNLEYLADAATLRTGLDRRAYQYSLLRLGPAAGSPALVSPFSFLTLKNRVLMMNRPASARLQLLRYLLAGPLVVAAVLGYSAAQAKAPALAASSAEQLVALVVPAAKEPEPATKSFNEKVRRLAPARPKLAANGGSVGTKKRTTGPPDAPDGQKARPAAPIPGFKPYRGAARSYYVDGQDASAVEATALNPNDIESIQILKGEQAHQFLGYGGDSRSVIVVTTKANKDLPVVVELDEKIQRVAHGRLSMAPSPAPVLQPGQTVQGQGPQVPISYVAAPALAYITKNYPDGRITGVTEVKNAKTGQPNYRVEIAVGRRPRYAVFDERGQFVSE